MISSFPSGLEYINKRSVEMVVSSIRVGSSLTSRILIKIHLIAYFRLPGDWYLKAVFKADALQLRVYFRSLVDKFCMPFFVFWFVLFRFCNTEVTNPGKNCFTSHRIKL